MASMIHLCDRCGKVCEEDPIAPVVVGITAMRTGNYNFLDLSDAPGWLRAVMARPNPRMELCVTCAKEVVYLEADFVEAVVDREAELLRINEAAANKIKERVREDQTRTATRLAKHIPKKG